MIAYMQRQYGNAIRRHKGDLEGMKNACWAVYYHPLAMPSNNTHQCCPVGKQSWCYYQKAVANGETPPARYPTMRLAQDLAEHVKPVFDRLCNEELLSKCLLGYTQNQNESLNSVIWRRCPKVSYARIHSVEIAVHLAILTFNHGMKGLVPLYEKFCGPILPATLKLFRDADRQRVSQAERRAKDAQKQHRQHLQSMALARESGHIAAEGTTYESGAY